MSIPIEHRSTVANCTKAAGMIGVPGAFSFGADVPFLVGTWTIGAGMIMDDAGGASNEKEMKALATTAVSSVAVFLAGSKLATTLFNILPGPGTLAAIGVNSSLNAIFTYRFLRSVAKIYDTYDDEEMRNRAMMSGITLLSVWSIPADFAEMIEILSDADADTAEEIKKRANSV